MMSMLPLEYIPFHEIICCQFYYLFVLSTVNANKGACPKELMHVSWEGLSNIIDSSNNCFTDQLEVETQLKFLTFFYSVSILYRNISYTSLYTIDFIVSHLIQKIPLTIITCVCDSVCDISYC